jgi:hypothetical protein
MGCPTYCTVYDDAFIPHAPCSMIVVSKESQLCVYGLRIYSDY